jgi:Uma2 family endonuclease
MRDDGNRYELIDGMLIVSPSPGRRHQRIVYRLFGVLAQACPAEYDVIGARFAVRTDDENELQPDVLVGWEKDFTEKNLPTAPQLTVEVLSPSSMINDFNNKKAAYERMGTPSYWIIDPDGPVLTVFELDEDGKYQQVAETKGGTTFDATQPYPVRIVPTELLDRR